MKFPFVLFGALLAGCSQAPGNLDATSNGEAAPSPTETKPRQQSTQSAQDMVADERHAQAAVVAKAEGTVEAIDESAGKITIAHGPVYALKWPAMTMAFRATPEQMASVSTGQKVHFEFTTQGMDATTASIGPAK